MVSAERISDDNNNNVNVVSISVKDTGAGIDPEILPRLPISFLILPTGNSLLS